MGKGDSGLRSPEGEGRGWPAGYLNPGNSSAMIEWVENSQIVP